MAKYQFYEDKKRDLFLSRLSDIFKIKASLVANFLNFGQTSSVRINNLKDKSYGEIKENLKKLADIEDISWCKDAFILNSNKHQLTQSGLFYNGYVYIQNASSLVPVLALAPEEQEDILDMCASPGGKASYIAALTQNKANLWLNDALKPRVAKMKQVLDLQGVRATNITQLPAEDLDKTITRRFDKVLLDAQCSGEGMINLSLPRALKYWSLKRIDKFSDLQKKMIVAAFNLLKKDGILVYSTCTFAPEENEMVIDYLLKKYPAQVVIEKIDLDIPNQMPGLVTWNNQILNADLNKAMRVIPTKFMEGFFVCKLRKI